MEAKNAPEQRAAGYNGLTEQRQALPAHYYFDRAHYERELRRIWFRNWIYVGRSEGLPAPRSFRTFEISDQRLLLVRDDAGQLQGFYNTCRHRGAALCQEAQGQLRSPAIICPYHAWAYDLHGELLRTSSKVHAHGFDVGDYSLYKNFRAGVERVRCSSPLVRIRRRCSRTSISRSIALTIGR